MCARKGEVFRSLFQDRRRVLVFSQRVGSLSQGCVAVDRVGAHGSRFLPLASTCDIHNARNVLCAVVLGLCASAKHTVQPRGKRRLPRAVAGASLYATHLHPNVTNPFTMLRYVLQLFLFVSGLHYSDADIRDFELVPEP